MKRCLGVIIISLFLMMPAVTFAKEGVVSDITISAVGDICPTSPSMGSLGTGKKLLRRVAPFLNKADLTVGNLETSLSKRGKRVGGKTYTFRSSPSFVSGLSLAGFDLLALGNNHVRDYGHVALADTITNLRKAEIGYAGAGRRKKDAWAPAIIERNGAKVAFLSFSEIGPASFAATKSRSGTAFSHSAKDMAAAVKKAQRKTDYVIVSIHWGVEGNTMPNAFQKKIGRALINAGADAVLGHHPHVVQGVEYYKKGIIAYSLGNFVFSPGSEAGRDSMILDLKLTPKGVRDAVATPARITKGAPQKATGKTGKRINALIRKRSQGCGTRAKIKSGKVFLSKKK